MTQITKTLLCFIMTSTCIIASLYPSLSWSSPDEAPSTTTTQPLRPVIPAPSGETAQAPASPPSPPSVQLSAEVFTQFVGVQTSSQRLSSFELSRAEVGIQSPDQAQWGGELRFEVIRSAGPDSLMGIDGDSLLPRVKRAWGFVSWGGARWSLIARFGLIPDPWHLIVMNAYPLRAVGPSQGEREGWQDTSDLGASAELTYRGQTFFLSVTNGEGPAYQEQNQGKNLLVGTRLTAGFEAGRLTFSAGYRDGSRGATSGRDHRMYAELDWRMSRLSVGGLVTQAWGVSGRPSLEALAAQGWVAGWAIPQYLGVFAQGEWVRYARGQADPLNQDATSVNSQATRWSSGFSQQLYRSATQASRSGAHRNSLIGGQGSLSLFETLSYRGPSNLRSPVFGVPQLAEEWRLSLTLCLTWGPAPLQANPSDLPPLF